MTKRRRNRRHRTINWERQAHWYEAEGQTPRTRLRTYDKTYRIAQPFVTVSQALSRREIVDTLCNELKKMGFTVRIDVYPKERPDTAVCELWRVRQQQAYLEKVLPHLISQQRKKEVEAYLEFLKRPKKRKFPYK